MDSMDMDEYADWMAYEHVEPFEPQRADLRAGMQTAALINFHIPRGKPRTKAKDFMPDFYKKEKPQMTPEEMQAQFRAALGGK